MNATVAETQISAVHNADSDRNGISDVEDILRSIKIGVSVGNRNAGTGTNFESALQAVEQTFASLGTQPGEGNLIFFSDSNSNSSRIADEAQRLNELGVNLSAFGVGRSASLPSLAFV